MPEWRQPSSPPAQKPASARTLIRSIDELGFKLKSDYSILNLAAQGWGVIARLAGLAGRLDLVDRSFAQLRGSIIARDPLIKWPYLRILEFVPGLSR